MQISKLQKIGKKLDNINQYIKNNNIDDKGLLDYIIPKFEKLLHSNTNQNQEDELIEFFDNIFETIEIITFNRTF